MSKTARTVLITVVATVIAVTAFNFWMSDQIFGNQKVETRKVDPEK